MVPHPVLLGLGVAGWLVIVPAVRADDFAMDLEVKAGMAVKKVHADSSGPGLKPKPRPVLEVRTGEPIHVTWTVTCTAQKTTYPDVLIHLFVVKEGKPGQEAVPKLDRDVPAESALTMDFKPGRKAQGALEVKLKQPGPYLLRLETIGAAVGSAGHEHFAALDLVVR